MKKGNKIISKSNMQIVDKISDIMPAADVTKFFQDLMYVYNENKKIDLEIEGIRAKEEVLLHEMELKYELYNKIFYEIFSERRLAINKSFEIIDKGIANQDREIISLGLSTLSKIVTTSPFLDLESLSNALENKEKIEI